MGLLGNAGLNAPLYVYVSAWFDRRRGSALALISSGGYLAGFVWPTIFERSIANFGWRWTMIGYAVFQVAVIVPLAAWYLRPPPQAPTVSAPIGGSAAKPLVLGWPPNVVFALDRGRIVHVLRHDVDAAGASGRAVHRPRYLRDDGRGHALRAARRGLSSAGKTGGWRRGPHRRIVDRAVELCSAGGRE